MALMYTPECDSGWKAPDFQLIGVDENYHSLSDIKGPNGLLVMFICNHCPYVKGIMDRLPETMKRLQTEGIGVVAINANDTDSYTEDSFSNMQIFAKTNGFTFPYLFDETQETARFYDAVCTPDFFGFNADLELQYRGRLDDAGRNAASDTTEPELLQAMLGIAKTGHCQTHHQTPSMGCSIKWKPEVTPA